MVRFLNKTGDLFLHIPRTGGTWVEGAIWNSEISASRWLKKQPKQYAMKHCLLSLHNRDVQSRINRVFSFVRHPIPYYESVWRWIKFSNVPRKMRIINRYDWHPHFSAIKLYHEDFNVWVERILNEEPLWYTRLVEQYVGPQDGEFCNYIGRTETLNSDFCEVMVWLGYSKQINIHKDIILSSRNKNSSEVNRPTWNDCLKKCVVGTERLLIDRFYGSNIKKRFYAPTVEGKDTKCLNL